MRGFQLWVNLPSSEKMKPAAYQNIEPEEITEIPLEQGLIRLVAGSLDIDGSRYEGPVSGISRQPIFMEVRLRSGEAIELPVANELSGFVYLFEGAAKLGEETLEIHEAAELSEGDSIHISAGADGARFMLIAGQAINEPIAQYGPFVMNTMDEIEQAISDYRANRLTD
jgi:redox-sensitive bicupin YhaK (pirin superfamily)